MIASLLADTTVTMTAAPDLSSVSTLVFTVLGSIFMAFVAVRMFFAYAKKQWAELVTEAAAIVFIGWFIWFPDSAKTTIQAIVKGVFG